MIKYVNCLFIHKRRDCACSDFAIKHFILHGVIVRGGRETFDQDVKFLRVKSIPIENELWKEDSRGLLVVKLISIKGIPLSIGLIARIVSLKDRRASL